jgi:hypothetical protein
MPYIKQERRDRFDSWIDNLAKAVAYAPEAETNRMGDLNYIITRLLKEVYKGQDCYRTYNERIGLLESAKLEAYRKQIAYYEDTKLILNGDV